jgi:hypothetical protein
MPACSDSSLSSRANKIQTSEFLQDRDTQTRPFTVFGL